MTRAGATFAPMRIGAAVLGLALAAASMIAVTSLPASADDFPSQPIHVVVPVPPGSAPDFLSRIFGASLQQQWGQPIIVDNKPGASQNIGAEFVARAAPDGYTLLSAPPPPIALNKFLYPNIKFDPERFAAVTVICTVPNVLLVRAGLPAATLAQFAELARTSPAGLAYGSTGAGSTLHLSAEALKARLGANFVHVPFKGAVEVLTELLAGRLDFAFVNLLDAYPHLSGGSLRAIAIGYDHRDPALPDVPALNEMWPGMLSSTWYAVVAPPDTPLALREKLADGIRAAFRAPEAAKRLQELHANAVLDSPAEAARLIQEDTQRWGAVIKAATIKGE